MIRGDPDDRAEDVLDLGRRARVPRWAYLAGGLLVAIVVAGSVLAATQGGHSPSAAPGSSPGAGATASSDLPGGEPVGGDLGPDADDVLVLGTYLFRLAPDSLTRTDATDSPATVATLPISGLDALGPADSYHLVGDAAAHLVWLVGYGAGPTTLLAVDTDTMAVRARVNVAQAVNAAAALNGDLYVVTDNAVVDVPVSRPAENVTQLTSQYMSVAADRTRHRLVLFDVASRRAVSYDPATRALRDGSKLPIGKGDVLVDGSGRVWVGGYRYSSGGGAFLAGLDPRTLRPIVSSPLAASLGPGAQLVAAGSSVVWVRSGAGGDDLWCVDGRTGLPAQHWHAAGAVASRPGFAVTDRVGTVRPLTLRGCRG